MGFPDPRRRQLVAMPMFCGRPMNVFNVSIANESGPPEYVRFTSSSGGIADDPGRQLRATFRTCRSGRSMPVLAGLSRLPQQGCEIRSGPATDVAYGRAGPFMLRCP